MALKGVQGVFTGTGTSNSFKIGAAVPLSLDFAGASTVQLQRSFDGGTVWKVVESFTADYEGIVDGTGELYRLECTAFTNNVTYLLGRID